MTQSKNIFIKRMEESYRGLGKSIILVLVPMIFLHFSYINVSDKVPDKLLPFSARGKTNIQRNMGNNSGRRTYAGSSSRANYQWH